MGVVQERKSDRRKAIIQSARLLIKKHGLSGVTLAMVAADVNLSRPNFYRFFGSKADLIAAVVAFETNEINKRRQQEVMRLRSFNRRVVRSLELAVEIVANDELWSLLIDPQNVPYTAYAASNDPAMLEANKAYWLPILEDAIKSGDLRQDLDPNKIMTWLLGVQFMFMERREIFPSVKDVKTYAECFVVPALLRQR